MSQRVNGRGLGCGIPLPCTEPRRLLCAVAPTAGVDRICAVLREQGLLDDAVSAQLQQVGTCTATAAACCLLEPSWPVTPPNLLSNHMLLSRSCGVLEDRAPGRVYCGAPGAPQHPSAVCPDVPSELLRWHHTTHVPALHMFRIRPQGKAYWRAERSICARLLSAPRPLQQAAALTGEEVLRAHEAKSFDYRVCLPPCVPQPRDLYSWWQGNRTGLVNVAM